MWKVCKLQVAVLTLTTHELQCLEDRRIMRTCSEGKETVGRRWSPVVKVESQEGTAIKWGLAELAGAAHWEKNTSSALNSALPVARYLR